MGVINKIRAHTGLAVGIIALGLILFLVGGDLLSVNSALLGGNRNYVGEIMGEDVSLEEFRAQLSKITYQYRINTGNSPDAQTMSSLRDQAWQQLIHEIAYQSEYEQVGLSVSEAELIDMVQGDHIRSDLKTGFKDEETNEFDLQKLQDYLQNLSNLSAERQALWYEYEQSLIPTRLREKYTNLLEKSVYITQAEAEWASTIDQRRLDLRYLYIPYDNLPDSNFQVTEDEMRSYLSAHDYMYQREEQRGIYYCTFPIKPSAEDTAYTREEITTLGDELRESEDDSLFVSLQSEGSKPYQRLRPDELPDALSDQVDSLVVGQVIVPILQRDRYIAYKLSSKEDADGAYMRASHILLRSEDETEEAKEQAHEKAEEVLLKLKKGADFKEMAVEHSLDPSAANGGDLGWFSKGDMVAPFEEAAFSATEKGLIPRVIDTEFGTHIIKVTELPRSEVFVVSTLERAIIARDESRDRAYQKSADFLALCSDTASFLVAVDTMKLNMQRAPRIRPTDTRVGRLSDVRGVIQWLFNEAEVGSVSEIQELSDAFFVCVMSDEQEEGLANYSSVVEELRTKVMNRAKSRQIIDSLSHKMQDKELSLDEIAQLFPAGQAYVYSMNGLRFSDRSLRGIGNEPLALGAASALKTIGQRSSIIAGERGILLLELTSIEDETEAEELDKYIDQLLNKQKGSLYQNLNKSIEHLGEIKDLRHKFY